ncbi:signal transduction histidine kinase [Paenibacillus phyllosphaerae]|uniref:histidine kinase n=1 Tax=Paenibacillus phyllosphaerae TaxID=274593 RepID=A0A7W5AWV7_9BACL|nr:sensor histidine kinase [Paenibacillus phyllosphaerae]MBB3110285.1 signal transduction histidine kinase [Paenibacillus phyllosphaerae]
MSSSGRQLMKLLFKYACFSAIIIACFVSLTALINDGLRIPNFPTAYSSLEPELRSEIYLGEIPVSSGHVQDSTIAWRSLTSVLGTEEAARFAGEYWVKLRPHQLKLREPSLWIRGLQHYEVYVNDERVQSFNMRMNPYVKTDNHFRLQPVPAEGETYIRIIQPEPGIELYEATVMMTSAEKAYSHIFRQNAVKMMLGIIFVFIGLVALFAYAANRRQLYYLFFSLMALGQGLGCVLNSEALDYFVDTSTANYFYPLVLPLSMLAYIAFLEQLYPAVGRGSIRFCRRIVLVYYIGCAMVAWIDQPLFLALTGQPFHLMLASILLVISVSLVRNSGFQVDGKIEWVLFGNAIMVFLWLHKWMFAQFPSVYVWMYDHWPLYTFYWATDIVYVAGFVFVLCMGMVLASHFREIHHQAQTFAAELSHLNQSLEEQVRERTAVLEETHAQLEASMKETFEALNEVAIWEERNRISHEIHDILGHKLTGAAIQLEAAKRLMPKDPEQAQNKLDAALESVRKGLVDVRAAVRMMKDDFSRANLPDTLNELMDETEQMTGITITRDIRPLPELDAKHKKIIYHALQEGLTNGIKHGRCHRFDFKLYTDGDMIAFLLHNDGTPFAAVPDGFGLSTMRERIRLLGGSVEMSRAHGDPAGALLNIRIPLQEPA